MHWCLLVVDIPARKLLYMDRCAVCSVDCGQPVCNSVTVTRRLPALMQASLCWPSDQSVTVMTTGQNCRRRLRYRRLHCSMIGRADYFSPARAAFLLRALFAWLVLEAHDKGCAERIFGARSAAHSTSSNAHDAHAGQHAAAAPDGIRALGVQALARATQLSLKLLQLPYQLLFAESAAAAAPHVSGVAAQLVARAGWRGYVVEGMPRQLDESSCGVFMTAFATQVLMGHAPPYAFSQADVPALRTAIAATLLDLPGAPQLDFAEQPFSMPYRATWWPWG